MDFRPRIVLHFKDGEIKKGYSRNFAFYKKAFDILEVGSKTKEEGETLEIIFEDLKAAFFVKDFNGNEGYHTNSKAERYGFGDRVEVTFADDETIIGYTPNYRENNNGFILYPADNETNNEIVGVVRSATQSIKTEKKHSYFSLL